MSPTRRSFLRTSTVTTTGLLAGLAGCTSGDGGAGTDTPTETPASVALSVTDQEIDGRSVTVPVADIDAAAWLVVHPEAEGGGPNGAVTLATRQLDAGPHADVSLELDRVLAGSQTVFGMLHYEDPADGEFTFPASGDPPVTKDGSPVVKPFEVTYPGTVTPELTVIDQESDGSTVTVPSFAIDETGWFVIHPEAEGGGPNGGVTLATVPIEAGLYADMTVELDEPLAESQTIYGMLHYEDPADGEFTFPGEGDPPVTSDGSPLLKPFDVTVAGGSEPSMRTVEMIDTTFDPERVSVEPGTTVRWVNQDSYGHDVTAAKFHDSAADWSFSETLGGGESTTYTFEDAGIYEYYCTIHGESNMCGVVLVGDVTLDQDLPCE